MKVIGIDPGIANTAVVAVQQSNQSGIELLYTKHIKTQSNDCIDNRLLHIFNSIVNAVELYKPDIIAVEEVFFSRNKSSATTTAYVIGLCILIAATRDIQSVLIAPNVMKRELTGDYKASKSDVKYAIIELGIEVNDICGGTIENISSHHIYDAIGIAICGINSVN